MKSKRAPVPTSVVEKNVSLTPSYSLFNNTNFLWMIAGAVVMIIGFLVMAGGRSDNPAVFNDNEVYSTTRITIAPILILTGLVILMFSLFRNQKKG